MKIQWAMRGKEALNRRLRDRSLIRLPVSQFLQKMVKIVMARVKRTVPVDTRRLRNSIYGTTDRYKGASVGSPLAYAADVEFGVPAGTRVSAVDLIPWATRRGFNQPEVAATRIARRIMRLGRKGMFVFNDAVEDSARDFDNIADKAIVDIVEQWKRSKRAASTGGTPVITAMRGTLYDVGKFLGDIAAHGFPVSSGVRGALYGTAGMLGDLSAVKKGAIVSRIVRRGVGRLAGTKVLGGVGSQVGRGAARRGAVRITGKFTGRGLGKLPR